MGGWKQRTALVDPGVTYENICSTDRFFVFCHITLVRIFVQSFDLPRSAFVDCFLEVLKFVKEKSVSSLSWSLLQTSTFSSPSILCSSKILSSTFSCFSLAFFPFCRPLLAFWKLAPSITSSDLTKTRLKREKRRDSNAEKASHSCRKRSRTWNLWEIVYHLQIVQYIALIVFCFPWLFY